MKRCIYSLLSIISTFLCYAQELPLVIPNSPEVIEFMKHGNTSVNIYRGKPNITIPIHNIKGREYSMPITLNYDAGGIKVSQIATQVGLGWSLQAGGMISRVVNGKPDHVDYSSHCFDSYYTKYDEIKAFYNTPNPQRSPFRRTPLGIDLNSVANTYFPKNPIYHPTLVSYFLFQDDILEGRIDSQPDTYSFNVGNISGDIYIEPVTGKAICTNGKNYQINYTGNINNYEGGGITSWHIIDELGTQYFFNITDKTKTLVGDLDANNVSKYTSSWKLTKIISANKKDTILFNYTLSDFWINEKFVPKHNTSLQTLINQNNVSAGCPKNIASSSNNSNPYKLTEHYLSSISINGKKEITFIQSPLERKDLLSRYPLEKIVIANGIEWYLHQSYFKSSLGLNLNSLPSLIEDDLRLKLDKISIKASATKAIKNEYSFDYFNQNAVPNRHSFSQDYWGFYNGKKNSTLIPEETIRTRVTTYINGSYRPSLVNVNLPGADRAPNLSASKVGTLKRITYPTGGYTEFEYNLNTSSTRKQTLETEYKEIGNLIGGDHPTINGGLYNYFDDAHFNDSPLGKEIVIPIYKPGLKNIQIKYTAPNVSNSDSGILFVALLKCSDTMVPKLDECGNPVNISRPAMCPPYRSLDWYDIINYPKSERILVKDYIGGANRYAVPNGFTETFPVILEAGYYKLYILNGATGSNLSVTTISDIENNALVTKPIGGLRVTKIKDYLKEATQPVLTKQYIYNTKISDCDSLLTSGIEHASPVYSKILRKQTQLSNSDFTCAYLNRFSYPINAVQSSHVGYSRVKEIYIDENQDINDYKEYEFHNNKINTNNIGYTPYLKFNFKNGNIKEMLSYNKLGELQQKIKNSYSETRINKSIHGFKTITGNNEDIRAGLLFYEKDNGDQVYINGGCGIGTGTVTFRVFGGKLIHQRCSTQYEYINRPYIMLDNYLHLDETITTNYFKNDSITIKANYYYDGLTQYPKTHRQVTRTETSNSSGEIIKSKVFYPEDVINTTSLGNNTLSTEEFNAITLLKNNNNVAIPIQTETSIENLTGTILSKTIQRTNYKDFGNNLILPKTIQSSKNNAALEDRLTYHKYDNKGNLIEISKTDGLHIVYVWGYNNQYPIAKIENYKLDTLLSGLSFTNATTQLSNSDNDRTIGYTGNEGLLRQKLDNLRNHSNLSNAQITTYTYDPLIGITSITNPRGETIYYHYDNFNRLEYVKDAQGKILKKNEYHYKE